MRFQRTILALLAAGAVPALGADVTYFPAAKVSAAFDAGAVLYDGAGGNYMVHASRREKAGQAEVHLRDADVIYVLEGATTFVTGGTVVDARTTAPDEIRGSAIENGEARRLAQGDVIIVPKGTPHWFKEVEEPVLYYVVKVR
jgi:mannose-6-phosphate isomerase-like protein (cupin superfamily)